MSNKELYGKSYPAFEYDGEVLEMQYSEAQIAVREEGEDIRTLDGRLHRYLDGYRIQIKVKLMQILEDAQDRTFVQLIQMLNTAYSAGEAVMVYPHFGSSASPRGYLCNVPKEYEPRLLGKVAAGQSLELSFEARDLADSIPAYTDQPLLPPWILYSGVPLTLWDGTGLELGR